MLCNLSISTINNNLSTFYKTNYDVNLFYPFLDRLMEFDLDKDFLHDEFNILLTKDDLDSIDRNNIKNEDGTVHYLNLMPMWGTMVFIS